MEEKNNIFFGSNVATLAMNESTVFANEDIVCGADIGWMSQMEDGGVTWVDDDGGNNRSTCFIER